MVQKELIFDYTIPGLYNAGIRSWSNDLLDALSSSGLFNITIVAPYEFDHLKKYGEIIVIPYYDIKIPLFHRFFYYEFRLSKVLLGFNSKIIFSPYFQLPKKILKKSTCVITIHDTLYFDLAHKYKRIDLILLLKLTNYYHNFNIKHSKHIVSVSQFTKNRLLNLFDIKILEVFYNVPKFQVKSENGKVFFCYFGGWEHRKRPETAMIIGNMILRRNKNCKFVVSGITFDLIKSYFDPDVLNRIICEDRFSKSDMYFYLSNSFISLYTSSFEGFGIPLLESQLYGVPVLIGDDLIVTDELPLEGLITMNLSKLEDEGISVILNNIDSIDPIIIANNAKDKLSLLIEKNKLFPKILYDAI